MLPKITGRCRTSLWHNTAHYEAMCIPVGNEIASPPVGYWSLHVRNDRGCCALNCSVCDACNIILQNLEDIL